MEGAGGGELCRVSRKERVEVLCGTGVGPSQCHCVSHSEYMDILDTSLCVCVGRGLRGGGTERERRGENGL